MSIAVALKAIAGGLVILAVLLLAEKGSGRLAGFVTLFPTLTLISFVMVATQARASFETAAAGALLALPPLALLLTATYLSLRLGQEPWLAIGLGTCAWLLSTIAVYRLWLS